MGANDDTVTRGDFFVRVDGRVERAGMLPLGRLLAQAIPVDDVAAYGTDGIEPTVEDWPADVSVSLADAATCATVPAGEARKAWGLSCLRMPLRCG